MFHGYIEFKTFLDAQVPERNFKERRVLVELSPSSYLLLCGLVKDALEVNSDATPLLKRLASELKTAISNQPVPIELAGKADAIATIGFPAVRLDKAS